MNPDPKRLAALHRQVADVLERRGQLALRMARDHQAENQGQGPGPKNGVSDPTGNAGTTHNPDRHLHDALTFLLRTLYENDVALIEKVAYICANFDDKGKPKKPELKRERTSMPCKYCEDDAVKRGMCNNCYQYQYQRKVAKGCEWAELPPIPRDIIQNRGIKKDAKARVNPLTGDVEALGA